MTKLFISFIGSALLLSSCSSQHLPIDNTSADTAANIRQQSSSLKTYLLKSASVEEITHFKSFLAKYSENGLIELNGLQSKIDSDVVWHEVKIVNIGETRLLIAPLKNEQYIIASLDSSVLDLELLSLIDLRPSLDGNLVFVNKDLNIGAISTIVMSKEGEVLSSQLHSLGIKLGSQGNQQSGARPNTPQCRELDQKRQDAARTARNSILATGAALGATLTLKSTAPMRGILTGAGGSVISLDSTTHNIDKAIRANQEYNQKCPIIPSKSPKKQL